MTAVGMEKLEAQEEYGTDTDLEPGIDSAVKAEGGTIWLACPAYPARSISDING